MESSNGDEVLLAASDGETCSVSRDVVEQVNLVVVDGGIVEIERGLLSVTQVPVGESGETTSSSVDRGRRKRPQFEGEQVIVDDGSPTSRVGRITWYGCR